MQVSIVSTANGESMSLPYSPYDLLPIDNPRIEPHKDDSTYFYENVVKHMIPDIVQMEANGIPIDLDKVGELEQTVKEVIQKVHDKLRNNTCMLQFLETVITGLKKDKKVKLEEKRKEIEDFIKPFDVKNKVHRTYVINEYLKDRPNLHMEEWSVKDMKKLVQTGSFPFVELLIEKDIVPWMQETVDTAMQRLAQDKCDAYNKNKVDAKVEALETTDMITLFNPGSATQKQKFFAYYGIESEKQTDAGNPQWDRSELERLQRLLKLMLDEKEKESGSESECV